MTTHQTIKELGFVFGVDNGSTSGDLTRWSLGIKSPKGEWIYLSHEQIVILARYIEAAIESNPQLRTEVRRKSENVPTYGKMCGTCNETYVHKTKCPNSTMPLRRFE